jgi:hypothetical protein
MPLRSSAEAIIVTSALDRDRDADFAQHTPQQIDALLLDDAAYHVGIGGHEVDVQLERIRGAAAVVLPSLFEEHINHETHELDFPLSHGMYSYAKRILHCSRSCKMAPRFAARGPWMFETVNSWLVPVSERPWV